MEKAGRIMEDKLLARHAMTQQNIALKISASQTHNTPSLLLRQLCTTPSNCQLHPYEQLNCCSSLIDPVLDLESAGATTSKMNLKFHGHNIPCADAMSSRCYITSQDHGYQVDTQMLSKGWKELFGNANDVSNERNYCEDKPFFSVQFHPESSPGPCDLSSCSMFLFKMSWATRSQ